MSCSLQLTASRWGSRLLSHTIFFDVPTFAAIESYRLSSGSWPLFAYSYRNYRRVSDLFWCAVHSRTPRKCLFIQFLAIAHVLNKSHIYTIVCGVTLQWSGALYKEILNKCTAVYISTKTNAGRIPRQCTVQIISYFSFPLQKVRIPFLLLVE